MTCDEFQLYLSERNAPGDVAAAEHMQRCPECRRLGSAHDEVLRCLHELRDETPQPSEALDAAVMISYRREKGSRADSAMALVKRFAWIPIAAVVVIAAALWVTREGKHKTITLPTVRLETSTQVQLSKQPESVANGLAPVRRTPKTVRPRQHVDHHPPAETPSTALASTEQQPASSGFRNLMYCDPISCGGAMQVIRIQVPAMDMEPFPTARPSRGLVQADVVVGPDGVARAIRFVK